MGPTRRPVHGLVRRGDLLAHFGGAAGDAGHYRLFEYLEADMALLTAGQRDFTHSSEATRPPITWKSPRTQVDLSVPFMPFGNSPPDETPGLSAKYTIRNTCCGVRLNAFASASAGTILALSFTSIP